MRKEKLKATELKKNKRKLCKKIASKYKREW